jgi:murein DD-endopeptidase MepM/ murein hydrolase activator NlpD
MGRKKYYTLLIMPSTPGDRIRKISLPSSCWAVFTVLAVAIVFWAGIGTWSIYHHNQMVSRCLHLEAQNEMARHQLENQKEKVGYLDQQLKKIGQQASFVKKFLGLDHGGAPSGKIGQGGEEAPPKGLSSASEPISSAHQESAIPYHREQFACVSPQEIDILYKDLGEIIKTLHNRQEEIESTPSISPVDPETTWISSAFGLRVSPFTGKEKLHLGIDIAGHKATPIMATAKGKVVYVGKWGPLGLKVQIKHNASFSTEYGHLLDAAVKKGQEVDRGEIIGRMGNSGKSTGYHVHYGIKKKGKYVNPFPYLMDWARNTLLSEGGKEPDSAG